MKEDRAKQYHKNTVFLMLYENKRRKSWRATKLEVLAFKEFGKMNFV